MQIFRNCILLFGILTLLAAFGACSKFNSLIKNGNLKEAGLYIEYNMIKNKQKAYLKLAEAYFLKGDFKSSAYYYKKCGDTDKYKLSYKKYADDLLNNKDYFIALQYYSLIDLKDKIKEVNKIIADEYFEKWNYKLAETYYLNADLPEKATLAKKKQFSRKK